MIQVDDARRRDRDYLRDLALELADRPGLGRQALSLVLGGIRERAPGAGKATWRTGIACVLMPGAGVGGSSLSAVAQVVHGSNGFACAGTVTGGGRGCDGPTGRLAGAREPAGWHCTVRPRLQTAESCECPQRPHSGMLKASDADREQAANRLRRAATEGRLSAGELEQRLEAALAATTCDELGWVVSDLSSDREPSPPASFQELLPRGPRRAALAALLVIVLLIAGAVGVGFVRTSRAAPGSLQGSGNTQAQSP